MELGGSRIANRDSGLVRDCGLVRRDCEKGHLLCRDLRELKVHLGPEPVPDLGEAAHGKCARAAQICTGGKKRVEPRRLN